MSELKDAIQKINQMHNILICGEKPREGLVFKVEQHADFVNFWKKFGWALLVAGLTIPPGVVTVIILNLIHVKTS